MEYHYFFFKPIPFDMVAWKLEDTHGKEFIRESYGYWCEWFIHHAMLFYPHQLNYHNKILFRTYIRENGLSEELGWTNLDANDEFVSYRVENGYKDIETREALKQLDAFLPPSMSDSLHSTADLLESFPDVLLKRRLNNTMTRFWFNNVIDNSGLEQKYLKELKYTEYLKTKHWRHIKALKVFIHRAQCSSDRCRNAGNEGYWGEWITDMHCHHISYKNKGNERYDDVCLLCDSCHIAVHQNKDSSIVSDLSTYILY
jgi:hypothetical protein